MSGFTPRPDHMRVLMVEDDPAMAGLLRRACFVSGTPARRGSSRATVDRSDADVEINVDAGVTDRVSGP